MPVSPELPSGRWLTVDPGEDTGWSLWKGDQLVEAGTEKLWAFGDQVWYGILGPTYCGREELTLLGDSDPNIALFATKPIELVVCEDWRLYPWAARDLSWDQCRTARLIGSLTQTCRISGVPFRVQPAAIKERAEAAGAAEYFSRPLDENRHANDAIRHAVYYIGLTRGSRPIPEASND